MRVISHDPFARLSFVRLTIPRADTFGAPTCAFCGGLGRYSYTYRRDDSLSGRDTERELWGAKRFCSVSCFRSYTE